MRQYRFSLLALLFVGGTVFAQGKAAPPAPPPVGTPEQLNDVLGKWEKAMAAVETFAAEIKRTDVKNTWKRTELSTGVAQYMKVTAGNRVSNLAILHLDNKSRPGHWVRYLFTGELFYEYSPAEKELRVSTPPAPKSGQVGDESILTFLFGMKAEEAKKRYLLTLQSPDDPDWVILLVKPRFDQDKIDFQQARLLLSRKTFLPRQLWFEQPTGDHFTWDLDKVQTGVKLDRNAFTAPTTPDGWKVVKVPPKQAEAAPRVYRGGQP